MLTTLADVPKDTQALASDVLTPVAEPRPGWTHTINSPLWIEGADKRAPAYAPAIGADSHAILEALGFDGRALARDGVTVHPSDDPPHEDEGEI